MRMAIIKILVIALLLGGGQKFYANKIDGILCEHCAATLSGSNSDLFSHGERHSVILEDNDVDLEEEQHSVSSRRQGEPSSPIADTLGFLSFYALQNKYFLGALKTSGTYSASTTSGQKYPIYIQHQVFRI